MKDLEPTQYTKTIADTTVELPTVVYDQPKYYRGRRRKAAVALSMIWGGTITLHLVSWGSWLILG